MTKILKDIGEFGLIGRIGQNIRTGPSVVKGIGDDCAVLKYSKDKFLLFTTDMIIEDVHFKKSAAQPEAIGHKALAVNISDIAACGGIPKWAVVSAGFPKTSEYAYTYAIFKGLARLARRFNIDIVGGDTNASEKIVISVALIGEVEKQRLILRSGAKRSDVICLSGPLSQAPDDLTFMPRIKEARLLVKNFNINCMIDISDGFLSDLTHILQESKKGAVIYESLIPHRPDGAPISAMLNQGEQFELIFTLPQADAKALPKGFYSVGEIVEGAGQITFVTRDGGRRQIAPRGYRHF